VIEEAQAVDDDVARAPRPFSIANEMQQVRLHLLVGELIGRPSIESGHPRDGAQVRLLCFLGHPAYHHVVGHPLT
jgi:hypothetical protein